MSELKTLKDLQKEYRWWFDTHKALRQEAIKHAKRELDEIKKARGKKILGHLGRLEAFCDFFNIKDDELE